MKSEAPLALALLSPVRREPLILLLHYYFQNRVCSLAEGQGQVPFSNTQTEICMKHGNGRVIRQAAPLLFISNCRRSLALWHYALVTQ